MQLNLYMSNQLFLNRILCIYYIYTYFGIHVNNNFESIQDKYLIIYIHISYIFTLNLRKV